MRSGCFRHVRLYSSGSAAKRAAGDSDISGKFDDNLVVEGLFHRPALLQRSAGINNPLVFWCTSGQSFLVVHNGYR